MKIAIAFATMQCCLAMIAGQNDAQIISKLDKLDVNAEFSDDGTRCWRLTIQGGKVEDRHIKIASGLGLLNTFIVKDASITNESFDHFAAMGSVGYLVLHGNTKVTGAGVSKLSRIGSLEALTFRRCPFTDAHAHGLADLKLLTSLSITGSKITDEALKSIAKMPVLQSLSIARNQITNQAVGNLAGMRNLKTLCLYETPVDDGCGVFLAKMPVLASLDLRKTKITSKILDSLRDCKNLTFLMVDGAIFDDQSLARINAEMPNLKVVRDMSE